MLENREITEGSTPICSQTKGTSGQQLSPITVRSIKNIIAKNQSWNCITNSRSYNSAYYEHTSLARLMGVELVEGSDLV